MEYEGEHNAVEQHYKSIHDTCGDVVDNTFKNDDEDLYSDSHTYINDLESWHNILGERTESELIKRGIREYQSSLFALIQGTYRHAFMTLRLHLEITLNAIYLSGYEKNLRDWKMGEMDTEWYSIISREDGLLSKSFASAFNEPLQDSVLKYQSLAFKVYKECSRYVHGNLDAEVPIPEEVTFDEETYLFWHDKSETIRRIVIFSLCLRYIQELDDPERESISDTVLEPLGHIKPLQAQIP